MSANGVQKTTILVTGAAGWLGGILADEILKNPKQTVNPHFILADIVEPKKPKGSENAVTIKADLTNPTEIDQLFTTEFGCPDVVYCLHGIMSRGSEDNFDLGLKVNIDSIREILQATRRHKTTSGELIKFIFTSSLAVYGGPAVVSPKVVNIDTIATPEGAYGMGKLSSELLVNEFTRRGIIDGRILRLPTIVVRPGVPSAATSAFISGIIREPLHGVEGICPVGNSLDAPELSLEAWVASPEITIQNFVIAMHVPASKFLSHTRVVYLPGFTTTVKQELEALEKVAGPEALKLVKFKDDPINRRIVGSWPARFDTEYPLGLGFVVDEGGMVPIVQRFKDGVEAGIW